MSTLLLSTGSLLPVSFMDRSSELRKIATECFALAQKTTDAGTRVTLITTAQNLLDLANAPAVQRFDAIVQEFNDGQMVK